MIAFIPQSSPIHSVDARVKILYLFFLFLLLIVRQNLVVLILCSLLTLLLYALGRIQLTQPLRDLGAGWLFIMLPIFLNLLINPRNGLYSGIMGSLFTLNIILLTMLGIYTTEVKSILQALVFFKVPSEFAFMLTVSIRFLPIMQEKLGRIRISQAVRGYELAPFSLPIPLLVPLLHSSLKRASELAISLESRGFDPENIGVAVDIRFSPADYFLLLLLPLLVFLTV